MKYPTSLIAVEGTDFSGKTTLIEGLSCYFKAQYGIDPLIIRVPGQTPEGKVIRQLVVGETHQQMSPTVNALLYTADWRHTLESVVIPALKQGRVVIVDRCNISMAVYQEQSPYIKELLEMTDRLIRPNKVLLLTTDYDTFTTRKASRDAPLNNTRDELSKKEFKRIHEGYLRYAEMYCDTVTIIDAKQEPTDVLTDAILAIENI